MKKSQTQASPGTLCTLLPDTAAAEMLGVQPATLTNWRCTKRYNLPYVKYGRKIFYRREDVEAFIDAHVVKAG